ncbi:hypothetical protein K3495_g5941 [Podosphaera aphanis]|nr:hypothetical protein K3495_g5941 [Podosphaera aphanis]
MNQEWPKLGDGTPYGPRFKLQAERGEIEVIIMVDGKCNQIFIRP